MDILNTPLGRPPFELRFEPLRGGAPAMAFPCDAGGHVLLDALSEQALQAYLYARVVMGFLYARPAVVPQADPARPDDGCTGAARGLRP